MKNNFSKIFAILASINKQPGVNLSHKQVVSDFTNGRTNSLSSLSQWEVQELERRLQSMAPRQLIDLSLDKTRKAIISQFLSIGRKAEDAKVWAEKYGVNGKKAKFNDYTGQELYVLLQNAKKVKEDTIKAITKQLRNGLQQEK